MKTLLGHTESVMSVAFSEEGQRLISAGLENNIVLWNLSSGEALRRFYGHDDAIYRVSTPIPPLHAHISMHTHGCTRTLAHAHARARTHTHARPHTTSLV